tara:strand:- start:21 stop:314 length:294 start_codon:yes stop_codon:yes gene_type:complete
MGSYDDPKGYAPAAKTKAKATTSTTPKEGKSDGTRVGEALKEARSRRAKNQGYASLEEKQTEKKATKKAKQKEKAKDLANKGKTKRAARVKKRSEKP